jgi:hypothetical protein
MEFDQSFQGRWKVALGTALLFTLSVTPLARVFGFLVAPLWVILALITGIAAVCSILAGERRKSVAWIAITLLTGDIGYLVVLTLINEKA